MLVRSCVEVVSRTNRQFSLDSFLSLEAMGQLRNVVEEALARVASNRILVRLDWDDWHVVYVDNVAYDVCTHPVVCARVTAIRARESTSAQVHLATNVEEWFQILLTTLDPLERLAYVKSDV